MRLLNRIRGAGGKSHEGTRRRSHEGVEGWRSGYQRSCACRACGRSGARRRFALDGAWDGRPGTGNRQRGTGRVAACARVWQMMADFHSGQRNRAPILRCAKGGPRGQYTSFVERSRWNRSASLTHELTVRYGSFCADYDWASDWGGLNRQACHSGSNWKCLASRRNHRAPPRRLRVVVDRSPSRGDMVRSPHMTTQSATYRPRPPCHRPACNGAAYSVGQRTESWRVCRVGPSPRERRAPDEARA